MKIIGAEPMMPGGWRVQYADKSITEIPEDHPQATDAARAWKNYQDIEEAPKTEGPQQ